LKICVFTTEIMDDFILGLDVLWAWCVGGLGGAMCYDWAKKCRCSTTTIILTYSGQRRGDSSWMWEGGDSTTRGPLEAVNGLVEPSMKTPHREGLNIARTLVQAWQ
jgi:hypothetical protein